MLISKKNCEGYNDKEIITKSLEELDYFSCLYIKYEQRMLNYIEKISSFSRAEAHDILQEAFIKVWRHLNEFDGEIKFSSWLYRIVHNQTIDCWRKNEKHIRSKDSIDQDNIERDHVGLDSKPDEDLESKMNRLLDALPEKYKEIIVLKYYENLSYDEISDVLRMPPGTVATRLNRAKKALKKNAEHDVLGLFE